MEMEKVIISEKILKKIEGLVKKLPIEEQEKIKQDRYIRHCILIDICPKCGGCTERFRDTYDTTIYKCLKCDAYITWQYR